MTEIIVASAQRTPVGSFMGTLSSFGAPKLGSIAIRAALEKINCDPHEVNDCIMGQVLTAGSGQAPARQAALLAGLKQSTPCLTINKVCGSGLKAVMMASDLIRLGDARVVVAGGQESMSNAPFLMENVRNGYRMGSQTLVDSMIKDGLWDPANNFHMGVAAELCVKEKKLTREELDQYSVESYKLAQEDNTKAYFKNEIVTVTVETKEGPKPFSNDEEPFKTQFDKIPKLKPVFDKDGSVTAANSSKLNDGGAALVIMEGAKAKSLGIVPLAKIKGYATFAQDPKWFTTAPIGAVKKLLDQLNMKVSDIAHWEINEAFAAVAIITIKELGLSRKLVNPFGGAVAIGHPIGCSGARILTTLVHGLQRTGERYGLATVCLGGGEAVAMVIERH